MPEEEITIEAEDKQKEPVESVAISEDLKYHPYEYIMNYYSKFPHIGSKVFSVLSLVPISLIAPKLLINGRHVKIHINLLWLSPPGYCKSTIAREFEKISFEPLMTTNMTLARLYHELDKKRGKKVSLIVEDIAVWFMDDEKIKFLEGCTGEEEISGRENMRNIKKIDNHVDLVSFCSGTPENITNQRIKQGIMRRFSPMIIHLSQKEHEDVISFIVHSAGRESSDSDSNEITSFYKELKNIQDGIHPDIKPITGYIMPSDTCKREISDFMISITSKLHKKYAISYATETEGFFRYACCLAFLRIFDKQRLGMIENNKLIIDTKDIEIAKRLIKNELSAKAIMLQCIEALDFYNIKTREQLLAWEERRRSYGKKELPSEAKFVMESNVRK